ncbi:MAG: redoxin domain-containing protein [Planctomycetes bacterium]|nr:redoxin domain-containing protein [Planctomycetota bacterium]
MTDRAQLVQKARELLTNNSNLRIPAPEFGADRTWLNTKRPLSLRADLRGKVVVLDFWTYCCINCMHVLEDMKYLEEKFAGAPVAFVGVHSAKFANEADAAHVRQAVLRENIEHAVVVDQDMAIWKSYQVRSWPTVMLVSPEGTILGQVAGEGQRAALQVLIEQALELYKSKAVILDTKPLPLRLERELELARELAYPGKIAVRASARELYIADTGHDRIVVTTLEGRFVCSIGSGRPGFVDGSLAEACFDKPQGLAFDGTTLYVADTHNHAIRKVDLLANTVSTVAGNGTLGYLRTGVMKAREIGLNSPWDVAVRGDSVLIAMAGPHQIWRLDLSQGTIGPIAGDGSERKLDGPSDKAAFAQPSGLALAGDLLFVADAEASSVRIVDLVGARVGTVAGGDTNPQNLFVFGDQDGRGLGKRFQHPLGLAFDQDVLYVADTFNHKIKWIDLRSGHVTSFAGDGEPGAADDDAAEANFREPSGVAVFERSLFVADTNNHSVRVIDLVDHTVTTLALEGVPIPAHVAIESGSASIDAQPLPALPGTRNFGVVKATLEPGEAELELRLTLQPGEKLAPQSPSQFRVLHDFGLTAAKAISGAIKGASTKIPLGVLGSGRLFVQALYYVCDAQGQCRLRSSRWTLEVDTGPRGKPNIVLEEKR